MPRENPIQLSHNNRKGRSTQSTTRPLRSHLFPSLISNRLNRQPARVLCASAHSLPLLLLLLLLLLPLLPLLQINTSFSFIPSHPTLVSSSPSSLSSLTGAPLPQPLDRYLSPFYTRLDNLRDLGKNPITANIIFSKRASPRMHAIPCSWSQNRHQTHKEIVRYAPRNHRLASPWRRIELQAKFPSSVGFRAALGHPASFTHKLYESFSSISMMAA